MEDLFNAVLAGDVEALERLARGGADLNATDEGGDPPLCVAARGGNLAIVRRLLDLGADPNFGTSALPLVEAAGGGHAPVVEALLQAGANPNVVDETGATALHLAAAAGHLETVHALTLAGGDAGRADPLGRVPAEYAAERGRREVADYLLRLTPVRKRERARRILDGLAAEPLLSPDEQLLRAAKSGDLEAARQLLAAGANVDASEDRDMTALEWAANRGHLKLVKLLIQAGADVNHVDGYDGTALDLARLGRQRHVVEYLYPLTKPELRDRRRSQRKG